MYLIGKNRKTTTTFEAEYCPPLLMCALPVNACLYQQYRHVINRKLMHQTFNYDWNIYDYLPVIISNSYSKKDGSILVVTEKC